MSAVLGTLCMFVARAAAKGAAAVAVAAAVIESLLVDGGVNGLGVAVAALAAKTCGRPFWWGAAAYGVIVVALGSESARPIVFFWGIGILIESAWRFLPGARRV